MLRKAGRELADYQVARIFKVPEEMQQSPCDFFGYTSIGRAILVEAKMVSGKILPIGYEPGLRPHQWNELCDANRAGAIALICWARGDYCATIDVDMATAFSEGRKSIPWEAIPAHLIRSMAGPKAHLELLSNWLPVQRGPLDCSTSGRASS